MSLSNPGPQSLSTTHRDIARWLLENPGKGRLKECADHFGYTQPWLSTLIHSDAFQALLVDLNKDADNIVVADIPSRLRGVAALAIDGLGDAVAIAMEDKSSMLHRGFLKDTVDMTLEKLGYGGKPATNVPPTSPFNQQNNFYAVDPAVLAGARARLLSQEVKPVTVSEAPKLPASTEGEKSKVQ